MTRRSCCLTLFFCALFQSSMWAECTISLTNVLDSYALADGAFSGTQSFNIWNDANCSKLTSDNGDLDDLTISYMTTLPSTTGTTPSSGAEFTSDNKITFEHAYTDPSTDFTVANPGSRIVNMMTFTFGSHVTVTDLQVDFTSLNTRGVTWEFSKLAYLQPDGSFFSPEPAVNAYLDHTATGTGAGGSPGTGWFLVDSKGTVTEVGETPVGGSDNIVEEGSNGSLENLTGTNGNSYLDYNDVGLAEGTRIGGFKWTTVLEDVRGTSNAQSTFSSTMSSFEASGSSTAVPEPSAFIFMSVILLVSAGRSYLNLRGFKSLPGH